MPTQPLTAKSFEKRLRAMSSKADAEKTKRYFKTGKGQYGEGDRFIGLADGEHCMFEPVMIEENQDTLSIT